MNLDPGHIQRHAVRGVKYQLMQTQNRAFWGMKLCNQVLEKHLNAYVCCVIFVIIMALSSIRSFPKMKTSGRNFFFLFGKINKNKEAVGVAQG